MRKIEKKFFNQNGQIALIVLAVMAVTLTLGLSLSERVLTDIRITEQEEESAKAFSAAEAGMEEALSVLKQGGNVEDIDTGAIATSLNVSNISLDITESGGSSSQFTYPNSVDPGKVIFIWLRDHTDTGYFDPSSGYTGTDINVCWDGGSDGAALEIIYFYQSGNYGVRRFAFDSGVDRRDSTGGNNGTEGNGFDNPGGSGCLGLDTSANLDLTTGTPMFLAIRPFYNRTTIGVFGSATLPTQGYEVTATGEVNPTGGTSKVSRRVKVFKSWGAIPGVLLETIFSGGEIRGN